MRASEEEDSVGSAARAAERVDAELRRLASVYDEPRVLQIGVRTSRRLTASLARAHLARAEIVLAEALLGSLHLEEVVTHEVAHVVCWWRHGRVRPHGAAWRQLVSEAGHVPSVSLLPRDVRLPARRARRRRRSSLHAFLRSLL